VKLRRSLIPPALGAFAATTALAGEPVARLIRYDAVVDVLRDGHVVKPFPDLALLAGDIIHTREGRAAVGYPDGSEVRLARSTRLQLTEGQGERNVDVFFGRLWAYIAKQKDRTTNFRSGGTIAAVRGTRIEWYSDGYVRVGVIDGEVELRIEGDGALRVHEGEQVTVKNGKFGPVEPFREGDIFREEGTLASRTDLGDDEPTVEMLEVVPVAGNNPFNPADPLKSAPGGGPSPPPPPPPVIPPPLATPTPTPTPTPSSVPTATPTPTPRPTRTPQSTRTPTPTPTGSPTATPTGSPTATPTASPTATPPCVISSGFGAGACAGGIDPGCCSGICAPTRSGICCDGGPGTPCTNSWQCCETPFTCTSTGICCKPITTSCSVVADCCPGVSDACVGGKCCLSSSGYGSGSCIGGIDPNCCSGICASTRPGAGNGICCDGGPGTPCTNSFQCCDSPFTCAPTGICCKPITTSCSVAADCCPGVADSCAGGRCCLSSNGFGSGSCVGGIDPNCCSGLCASTRPGPGNGICCDGGPGTPCTNSFQCCDSPFACSGGVCL
jgi:hypothetical protein